MSSLTKKLSSKVDKTTGRQEVILRFRSGRDFQYYAKTHIFILAKYFNTTTNDMSVKSRIMTPEMQEALSQKKQLDELSLIINSTFNSSDPQSLDKDWMQATVDHFMFPQQAAKSVPVKNTTKQAKSETGEQAQSKDSSQFFNNFTAFLEASHFGVARQRHYMVLMNTLRRFEKVRKIYLDYDTITSLTLQQFEAFMRNEHTFFTTDAEGHQVPKPSYQAIYADYPASRIPRPRGNNYICEEMKMLRAYILWTIKQDLTTNNPFKKYQMVQEVYGTPVYISEAERDQIYNTDLSSKPYMAIQRDIFIFQCYIGCRVSDLMQLTKESLSTDKFGTFISYIPQKTHNENPTTVKVYLSPVALEIIERYKKQLEDTNRILPTIAASNYNDYIKEIFRACNITRIVPVRDSVTGETKQVCIADIASSHMARRTFVGNLYKKVKDPNLVGKLSGHKEGSKAFARYRDIDDEIISNLTNLI